MANQASAAPVVPNTLLDGLLAAYDFRELTGNFASLVDGGPTLTDSGIQRMGGYFGRAINGVYSPFDETANHFVTGGTDSFWNAAAAQSFSLVLVVSTKPWTAETNSTVLSKQYGLLYEYSITSDYDSFVFALGDISSETPAGVSVSSYPAASGLWYGRMALLVCYYNATTHKIGISVNGGTVTEADVSGITVGHLTGSIFNLLTQYDNKVYNTVGAIDLFAFYNRVLTQAECLQFYNGGKYIEHPFALPSTDKTVNLVFDGDSLTAAGDYPAEVIARVGRAFPYSNFGVSGNSTSQMLARVAATLAAYDATCDTNYLFVWCGLNDIAAGTSANDAYANLEDYCAAAKAAGFTVVILTITTRHEIDDSVPKQTELASLNTQIKAMGSELVDYIVDVGGDAKFSNTQDGRYYVGDRIHLSPEGFLEVANLIIAAMDFPTCVITSTESSPTAANPIPIVFTFNKAVTGFNASVPRVAGTLSNMATADNIVFTADLTPTTDGYYSVDLDGNKVSDIAGNPNVSAARFEIEWSSTGYQVPAYTNTGGTGDRTGSITVTTDLSIASTIDKLVNGNTTESNLYFNNQAIAGKIIAKFVFATKVLITEAKFYQDSATAQGTVKWQIDPENDGNPQDVGSNFVLGAGAATQVQTSLSGNSTGAFAYQVVGVSGNASDAAWVREMEFKIGNPI